VAQENVKVLTCPKCGIKHRLDLSKMNKFACKCSYIWEFANCDKCGNKLVINLSKGNNFRCGNKKCGNIVKYVDPITDIEVVIKKPFKIEKGYVGLFNKQRKLYK